MICEDRIPQDGSAYFAPMCHLIIRFTVCAVLVVETSAAKHRRQRRLRFISVAHRRALGMAFTIEWLGTFGDGRSREKACTLWAHANGVIDAVKPVVDRRTAHGAFWGVHFA